MNSLTLIFIILFTPLVGGLMSYLAKSTTVSTISIGISFLLAVCLFLSLESPNYIQFEWVSGMNLGIALDKASILLVILVTFISLLVHIFSLEYMKGDTRKAQYFAKLGFFTFSMIGLLIADHLILLFVFWELVGLASYLLIGFWYAKEGVPSSARIAFMVNRVADVALLGGILLLNANQSLLMSEFEATWLFLPSMLIAIGAFGKSAQLPFSGWLTKAMVGPTPVSALIHAATMVAAGVYLLFRVAPYFPFEVQVVVALVGIFSAFYGGVCALNQHDIKKVLAYSTISQLGYMVMGIGVGAGQASLFHLWTHGFFKAGLFLGAGAIIHHLHQTSKVDAQDIRNMGGLRRLLPWTYRSFLVCGLALAGIPFFSGFMSKEGIIVAAWTWAEQLGTWAYLIPDLAFITALLTAFYVGRMIILVFFGESRMAEKITSLESIENWKIKIPLAILAIGSIFIFYYWNPLSSLSWINNYFGVSSVQSSSLTSNLATIISIVLSSGGLLLAYFLFKPNSNYAKGYAKLGAPSSMGGKLIFNGFFLTKVYQKVGNVSLSLGKGFSWFDLRVLDRSLHFMAIVGVIIGKAVSVIDRFVIDGLLNGSVGFFKVIGKQLAGINSRDIQTQLMWLLIGVILILGYLLLF